MFNLNIFSQQGTNKVCLPTDVAKQVASDLIRYDSIKNELKHVSFMLDIYKHKTIIQDTLLSYYRNRKLISDSIINLYNLKSVQYNSINNQLTNDNIKLQNKLQRKNITLSIVGGGFIVTLGILLGSILK